MLGKPTGDNQLIFVILLRQLANLFQDFTAVLLVLHPNHPAKLKPCHDGAKFRLADLKCRYCEALGGYSLIS